jgi:hypothetical protein
MQERLPSDNVIINLPFLYTDFLERDENEDFCNSFVCLSVCSIPQTVCVCACVCVGLCLCVNLWCVCVCVCVSVCVCVC